jgi:glycosyltransferase involved in cell wall biosynthesis
MTAPKLKNTSLCAIVRDEMMNPAGGIERFVRSIVPHVEQAVIFDTGSIDGTREKLEELQREFPTMKVYDRPFDNYVAARNASLKKVETSWTLVLDADELITLNGFAKLAPVLTDEGKTYSGFNFSMVVVSPEKDDYRSDNLHNPRLFKNKKYLRYHSPFSKLSGEYLYDFRLSPPREFCERGECVSRPGITKLYHFDPDMDGSRKKYNQWYSTKGGLIIPDFTRSPSTLSGFAKWKAFNIKRDRPEYI